MSTFGPRLADKVALITGERNCQGPCLTRAEMEYYLAAFLGPVGSPQRSDPYAVPLLATELPALSEDGLTATIPLRQGVRFHKSGNEMKAADVIFSWNRLKNIGFQGSFLAVDYWTDVTAVDDYTLQLTLAAPNAALAAVLTSLPLSAMDSARVQEFGGTRADP